RFTCQCQYLQCVDTSPIFPIESTGSAVGRCHERAPIFRLVGLGLAERFDTRTMYRTEQGIARLFTPSGGIDRIVLQAAIDFADEGCSVGYGRHHTAQR